MTSLYDMIFVSKILFNTPKFFYIYLILFLFTFYFFKYKNLLESVYLWWIKVISNGGPIFK